MDADDDTRRPMIRKEGFSAGLKKLFRQGNQKQDTITEEELRSLVDISHAEGVIEQDEKELISNVFDFGSQAARDIMIPRVDMTCVDVDASYQEVLALFREDKYTRIPVYEGDTDNIIGVLNVKDLLLISPQSTEKGRFHIREIMRPPLYVFELKKVSKLMNEMRSAAGNLAIVLNEYGSCVGMITLEDMLEEIVGEIRDEYDVEEENEHRRMKISDREYLVDGAMKLGDVNDIAGTELISEDYDSIGGYLTGVLGHLPQEGESVIEGGFQFVVDAANETRVEKVRIFALDEQQTV